MNEEYFSVEVLVWFQYSRIAPAIRADDATKIDRVDGKALEERDSQRRTIVLVEK